MFSLELCWPFENGGNETAHLVRHDDYNHLFGIAQDTDFRQWAADNGCAFVEIWADSNNLVYMQRVTRK